MSTLADLTSRTLSGLPSDQPELCSLQDVLNAVIQTLNVRAAFARASSINVLLSTSADLTINDFKQNITGTIGKGVPFGVELYSDGVYWPLRIVNVANLADYRFTLTSTFRDLVCAFYSDENGQHYVEFNDIPTAVIRIRFDKDRVATDLYAQSPLPDHLDELIVLESQNRMIPRVKNKIASSMRRNEEDRKDVQMILLTWDGVYLQNQQDIKPLEQLWMIWAFKDRRSESAPRRRTPRGRNLY